MKLSVIGLETTHGYIYPAMMNGYDPVQLNAKALDIVSTIFPTDGAPSVEGAEIVACYDEDPERARNVAASCLVDRVCPDLADAYRGVDGVVIAAGDATQHLALATPALQAGLATFVDKPFAATVADAEAMIELSERYSAPLFCTSAVRFSSQMTALRARIAESIGTPLAAHVIGTGDYTSYAVHSLECLISVWGGGVSRLQTLGEEGFDTIKLDYADGRRAIWQICKEMDWLFHISLFGTTGYDEAVIKFADRYDVFRNTAAEIATFARTRQSPVPVAETLEIVRVLAAVVHQRGNPEPVVFAPVGV